MPRCANGTRRNKKTGNCEKVQSRSQKGRMRTTLKIDQLQRKHEECLDKLAKMEKPTNLRGLKKKHNLSLKCQSYEDAIANFNGLSDDDIIEIMKPYKSEKKYSIVFMKLKTLKYDKNYTSSTNDKGFKNLKAMARAKVQEFFKDGVW